ncbi:MAG: hypothetical protein K8R54_17835 [Bacteroidales bacterium]|nr:hypothetical protein [Bacteroidales bacterium]
MKQLLITGTLILITVLSSCKKDEDTDILPEEESNIIFVTEDVTATTTWYSDKIYVIDDYDFYVDATLTIQAGTVIKFQQSEGAYLGLGSSGTIAANGTSSKPIIFTSYKDDIHGGDTNKDGTATNPATGDWNHININDANGSTFNYCEFYYGGNGSYNYTLTLYGSKNTKVTNCTFAHNRGGKDGDFYYGALDASEAEDGTVITGNVFYDNILPLSVSTSFNLDASNTFNNPGDVSETNTMNGIFVYAIDEISTNLIWSETDVAYVINDNDLWVNSGNSLTLADNVVIKFTPTSTLLLTDGTSAVNQGSGNYFTSFKDDSRKGDTNGDGTATFAAAGDWEGIYDDSMGIPSPYFFTWANILYDSY